MNRTELLGRLALLPFDKSDYWLAAGGAMVLYGFKEETGDIDLGCTTALADRLEQEHFPVTVLADGSRKITYAEDVEIFENWLRDRVVTEAGFPVVSVEGLIQMKEDLGREKDFRDLAVIRKRIAEKPDHLAVEIRLAVETDCAALAKIGRDDMGYTESTAELVKNKLKNTLKKEDECVFVAVCDDHVVGFVHAERYDVLYYPTMVNILGLAVREPYRRFGIATKLLTAAEDWARVIGVKEIRLNSGITRLGAHEFYRRNGFTDEKEQKRFLKTLE